jgi:hypothetical protein
MTRHLLSLLLVVEPLLVLITQAEVQTPSSPPLDLWELAQQSRATHRFSTLLTAQDVRDRLSTDAGIAQAINWCKRIGVTKVYVEEYRDGYQAERATLLKVKDAFAKAALEVCGCITTTQVGKPSTGWKPSISCYTDLPTQEKLQGIFEYAAEFFDEIMIDDFWFTDCTCSECDAARKSRLVTVGPKTYPVTGDTWEDYRCELMVRLSRDRLLGPAKRVNPKVRLIIKYPQWYDSFHERGYEVVRETQDFDRIWVGTESRDYNDRRWGGTVPYESCFIMRWLGQIGADKCGGGWFDWLGTTESTYVEQARQTVLAGARESMLFCYGGLQGSTGPKDVEALRANLPELLRVAQQVRAHEPIGIAAYKPANSHPEKEKCVFDFVGMLGLPLVPCHQFPISAPAAFFSVHALKDSNFIGQLESFLRAGHVALITDGLAQRLQGRLDLSGSNVHVLPIQGEPKSLLDLTEDAVNKMREPMLRPFDARFRGPNRVALYLFGGHGWVIENFNDEAVTVQLNGENLTVAARGWKYHWE